jgi:tRNA dimethylallyltransferase
MRIKLVAVVGPTAAGKSDLAVHLAKKFNGEVVSADSRQVYRGLNIGTGKITKREMRGVRHHLLDVANPKRQFSVAQFKKLADLTIKDIASRNKLPILCGGSGFYISIVIDNITLPEVPPNKELRKKLEKKPAEELFAILEKLDPRRARNIDSNNPRRLIRSIEIASLIGNVPPFGKQQSNYNTLQIGIKTDPKVLRNKINKRLAARLKKGMIAEVKKLRASGISWKRFDELGLEYRYVAKFLRGELSKTEMKNLLEAEIWKYAKRQKQWFRRDKRIKWFDAREIAEIEKEIKRFLG